MLLCSRDASELRKALLWIADYYAECAAEAKREGADYKYYIQKEEFCGSVGENVGRFGRVAYANLDELSSELKDQRNRSLKISEAGNDSDSELHARLAEFCRQIELRCIEHL